MQIRVPKHLIALGVLLAGSLSAHADTATLVHETFDSATNATVQSILASNPGALASGTSWSSTTGAGSVNLRLGTDAINGYNPGNPYQRFSFGPSGSSYFLPATAANKFLVMGDDSGQLAGGPYAGTFGYAIPFLLPGNTSSVSISFDWVFKAFKLNTDTSSDRFVAGIVGNGFSIANPQALTNIIVDQSLTAPGAAQGPASMTFSAVSLGQADTNGKYWLVFGLLENTPDVAQATNSAVGLDNISVTANIAAVPEPETYALMLAGLSLMGFVARRRQQRNS